MSTLDVLSRLDKETKAEVFLVGGFVRDLLRKKRNDDLDIVVRRFSIKNIVGFLSQHGFVKKVTIAQTNDNIRTTIVLFKAFDDKTEAQISLPRRGKRQIANLNNTLSQDAAHRDFTINSMYIPVSSISAKNLIDPLSGKEDISNRIIKTSGDPVEVIESSPIRILRALSLSARTGYSIDSKLMDAIRDRVNLISKVPVEAVREEFNKLIMSNKPSKYIRLLRKLGLLKMIVPELDACYGVTQEKKYHKYDVFTHCIYACDKSERDLVLRLAALFHDIGKPPTRKIIDGKVTFHKHEMASSKLTSRIMQRLKYSNEIKKQVVDLVRLHMYHYTREYTDAAIRRFIRKVGLTERDMENLDGFPLFKLRSAERLGNGHKTIPITEKQKDFQRRIVSVYKESTAISVDDLDINGQDLIQMFRLKPGKIIGEVLAYLLELVMEKPGINNKCDLLSRATVYLCNRKK